MSKRCEREVSLKSVHGDLYYVSASQLVGVAGKCGGCTMEFRNCIRTKTRRTSITLVFLGLLDLVVSLLLEECSLWVQSIFISIFSLYLFFSFVLSTYKEVVLIIRGLGVQISSTNWLGYTSSVFLPHTIIGDIIINEGITMCRVVFYLAVVIVGDKTDPHPHVEKLYPLFTAFNPRLSAILDTYHLLRDSLNLPTITPPTPSDTCTVTTDCL